MLLSEALTSAKSYSNSKCGPDIGQTTCHTCQVLGFHNLCHLLRRLQLLKDIEVHTAMPTVFLVYLEL